MTGTIAILKYFTNADGKPKSSEIRTLTSEDRVELGKLACKELGEEYEPPKFATALAAAKKK